MQSEMAIELNNGGEAAVFADAANSAHSEPWKRAIDCVKQVSYNLTNTKRNVGLKRHIADTLCISDSQVDQIFKGARQPGNPVEVLNECVNYLNAIANLSNREDWPAGGCKSVIFQAWNGSSRSIQQLPEPTLSASPVHKHISIDRLPHFDFWTPGVTTSEIAEYVKDSSIVTQLASLATDGVRGIADGDFAKQFRIGKETEAVGKSNGFAIAIVEGLYLQAESSRILADFEADRMRRLILQKDAIQLYEQVIDLQPNHVRAVRGRGRALEVLGRLDEALSEFDRAIGMLAVQEIQNPNAQRSTKHEQVRTLRHKVNCLATIHADMPRWAPSASSRKSEIDDLLRESTIRHRLQLSEFSSYGNWFAIEWFMAEVLHARALIEIYREHEALERLRSALASRLRMLRPGEAFSDVQRGNFLWWMSTAKRCSRVLTRSELNDLDMVEGQLIQGVNCEIVFPLLMAFASTY